MFFPTGYNSYIVYLCRNSRYNTFVSLQQTNFYVFLPTWLKRYLEELNRGAKSLWQRFVIEIDNDKIEFGLGVELGQLYRLLKTYLVAWKY